MNGQAYVWSKEHSPQRLRKIDALGRTWLRLFGELRDRGHYARHQWVDEEGLVKCESPFTANVNDRNTTVHLTVVAAKAWFARHVYLRALARTRARYSDFDTHRFVDGDRIGERRLEFANDRHELSGPHLWTSLWSVVEEEEPTVHEVCLFEPCGKWGSPVAAADPFEETPDPDHLRVTVVRNLDTITAEDIAILKRDFVGGRTPTLSTEPVTFDFETVRDGFMELSNPELVALNWADAVPPLSEADESLWKAAYCLDTAAVIRALKSGANVNQYRALDGSVLTQVIEGWRDHRRGLEAEEEGATSFWGQRPARPISHTEMLALLRRLLDAGAHPDLHGPNSYPPIVEAALAKDPDTVSVLLGYGADPGIQASWDEGPGAWPTAWEFATIDGFHLDKDERAREVYYRMIRARSSPLYTAEGEEQDRRDAALPPPQRSWQPPTLGRP